MNAGDLAPTVLSEILKESKSRIDLMLGKTVFLTKAEAEAALKEAQHE